MALSLAHTGCSRVDAEQSADRGSHNSCPRACTAMGLLVTVRTCTSPPATPQPGSPSQMGQSSNGTALSSTSGYFGGLLESPSWWGVRDKTALLLSWVDSGMVPWKVDFLLPGRAASLTLTLQPTHLSKYLPPLLGSSLVLQARCAPTCQEGCGGRVVWAASWWGQQCYRHTP